MLRAILKGNSLTAPQYVFHQVLLLERKSQYFLVGAKVSANKKFYRRLGLRLRELRGISTLTLEETESRGVKSWKHLQRIEAGEANITMQTLLLLSNLYSTHPSEVLKGL